MKQTSARREDMKREMLLVAVGVLLVIAGWSAGQAQARVANFEIGIEAPRGDVKVTCSRGCEWPSEAGSPLPTTTFSCDRERCRWMLNGYGRITLDMPR